MHHQEYDLESQLYLQYPKYLIYIFCFVLVVDAWYSHTRLVVSTSLWVVDAWYSHTRLVVSTSLWVVDAW